MSRNFAPLRLAKALFDSNELSWMLPLLPWSPPRQRSLRRLRRIARQQLRSQLVARQGWFRTLTQTLAWPLVSLLKAFIALRGHRVSPSTKFRLFVAYCWLQWAHNIRISDQQQHSLMFPQRRPHATSYMICREHQALLALTHGKASGHPNINEKQNCARFCSQNDLPSPAMLAHGEASHVETIPQWPEIDLILKPSNLLKGEGIEVLRYQPASQNWRGHNNVLVDPTTISTYASQRFRNGPWLLQPRLKNAEAWSPYTAGALSTIRVVTGQIQGSAPCLVEAYLRISRKETIIDNLSAGGIGTRVNLRSGQLSKGHIFTDDYVEHEIHPDTGTPIAGEVLPGFSEITALALRAHTLAAVWPTIGWDISLTESGPQLIEANLNWAILPRIPVTDTPYIEVMQSALSIS